MLHRTREPNTIFVAVLPGFAFSVPRLCYLRLVATRTRTRLYTLPFCLFSLLVAHATVPSGLALPTAATYCLSLYPTCRSLPRQRDIINRLTSAF